MHDQAHILTKAHQIYDFPTDYTALSEAQAAYTCQSLYILTFSTLFAEQAIANQLNGFLTSLNKNVGMAVNFL